MNQFIKSSIGFLLIGTIISLMSESCKIKAHASPVPHLNTIKINAWDIPYYKQLSQLKKDTTVKVELTEKQKLFYDKYFLPQFESLKAVIEAQAASIRSQTNSIHELSDYQATTRHRTDSIAHERNSYRELYLTSQRRDMAYQEENIKLSRQLIANQKADALSQKHQVIQNTIIANVALVGVLVIVGIIIGLYRKVNSIDKKFRHLLRNSHDV